MYNSKGGHKVLDTYLGLQQLGLYMGLAAVIIFIYLGVTKWTQNN